MLRFLRHSLRHQGSAIAVLHPRRQQHPPSSRITWGVSSAAATTGALLLNRFHNTTTRTQSEQAQPDEDDIKGKTDTTFDLTAEWERATKESSEFLQKWILTGSEDKDEQRKQEETSKDSLVSSPAFLKERLDKLLTKKNDEKTPETNAEHSSSMFNLVKDATSLLLNPTEKQQNEALERILETAHKSAARGDIQDKKSIAEIQSLLSTSLQKMQSMMEESFGHVDVTKLSPAASYYFVEREDETKNPSWKRRMHRFHPGIDFALVEDLYEALYVADLSYADSVQEIQEGLQKAKHPVEMIYCNTVSYPGRPAHLLLLLKDQSIWSSSLEVILVVRGSKTLSDVITDCLLEATDYRGGKGHAGILDSGRYLVEKHIDLLQSLRKAAGKRKIKLTLIGHSLGAGAATIAGIEFNDVEEIDAKVVGFGCPALLSQELSEECAPYVTTVIGDSDVVPRASGATVANVLMDMMEHNWKHSARRDTEHALRELQRLKVLSSSSVDQVLGLVDSSLESLVTIPPATKERMEPVLFPPGKCIHFYHDGSGFSGSVAPCTFFGEIDVTRRMIDDHTFESGYNQLFLSLMRQHRRDQNFIFENVKR